MSVNPCEKCKLNPGEAFDKGLESKCPYELERDEDGNLVRDNERFVCNRVIFKEKTTHGFIATWIMQNHIFKTLEDTDEILVYLEGYYQPIGEILIRKEVQNAFEVQKDERQVTRNFFNEVIGHVQRTTYTPRKAFDHNPRMLVVENGILDLNSGILNDHNPGHLSTLKLNV
jgi:hypothetical protein